MSKGFAACKGDPPVCQESFNATIGFDTPLSITKNNDIDFKTVSAGVGATRYRITTAGVMSVISGPGVKLFGTPVAGSLTIYGSGTQGITISIQNITAGSNGSAISNITGKYFKLAEGTFPMSVAAPLSTGRPLLLGCDITVPANRTAGTTDNPRFDVYVVYQ